MQVSGITGDTRSLFGGKPSASAAPRPKPVQIDLPGAPAVTINEDKLNKQVEALNDAFKAADAHLQFSVHKGSNDIVIKLVDDTTQQVIREIPSEKFLELVDSLQKIVGLNVDVKL
jgi:flagellar protein FlaG